MEIMVRLIISVHNRNYNWEYWNCILNSEIYFFTERYQRDLKGIMETVSNSLKDVFTPNKETGKSKITTAAEDLMKMVGSMFGKQRK